MQSVIRFGDYRSFLSLCVVALPTIGTIPGAIAAEWVPIEGQVKYGDTPLCAMVLANGQHMFSCSGDGSYQLTVPLDANGKIKIFSFASQFAPFEQVLTPDEADNFTVNMVRCQSLPTATQPLNDTGIDTCSDSDTNGLVCPASGFPEQDAQYGRDVKHNDDSDGHAGFSFTKLDINGDRLPASANNWSCVKDNNTGLVWEVKTNDGSLHDKNNTYTWYNPDNTANGGVPGTRNGGQCGGSDCDTHSYTQVVNAEGLCGIKHWRMPTIGELESIVSFDRYDPALELKFFPNTGKHYWSASLNAHDPRQARYINHYDGGSELGYKNVHMNARLTSGL